MPMKRESKVRVLLIDDRRLARQGLCRILELDEGIEVFGEAIWENQTGNSFMYKKEKHG
jgi:chemotaxis response regulator CheB